MPPPTLATTAAGTLSPTADKMPSPTLTTPSPTLATTADKISRTMPDRMHPTTADKTERLSPSGLWITRLEEGALVP
jgi:hypothetical protein